MEQNKTGADGRFYFFKFMSSLVVKSFSRILIWKCEYIIIILIFHHKRETKSTFLNRSQKLLNIFSYQNTEWIRVLFGSSRFRKYHTNTTIKIFQYYFFDHEIDNFRIFDLVQVISADNWKIGKKGNEKVIVFRRFIGWPRHVIILTDQTSGHL